MYKNTVIKVERESPSVVRSRGRGETARAAAAEAHKMGLAGVRTIVFPDEGMLTKWRERIAALA